MLEFKTPQIEDKAWVDQCFKHLKTMNCDYTFGNMFVWSTEYSTKICRFKDFFICSWGMGKEKNFGMPVGKGDFKEAVEEVIKYAKANDIMPRFYGVTEAYVEMLNENFYMMKVMEIIFTRLKKWLRLKEKNTTASATI